MRLLAKLLINLRKTVDKQEALSCFLSGEYFDAVTEAAEQICGFHFDEQGRRCFGTPSVVLTMGNILREVCHVKRGLAVRCGDESSSKDVGNFLHLLQNEYSDATSCLAPATLKSKKNNKPTKLPSTEDLIKLKKYTETKISSFIWTVKKTAQLQHMEGAVRSGPYSPACVQQKASK